MDKIEVNLDSEVVAKILYTKYILPSIWQNLLLATLGLIATFAMNLIIMTLACWIAMKIGGVI